MSDRPKLKLGKIKKNGEIVRDSYGSSGEIFWDWYAFLADKNAPCYVPEEEDVIFTKNDLIKLCDGSVKIADELFYWLKGEDPSILLEEWAETGRIYRCEKCGKFSVPMDEKNCPHCNAPKPKFLKVVGNFFEDEHEETINIFTEKKVYSVSTYSGMYECYKAGDEFRGQILTEFIIKYWGNQLFDRHATFYLLKSNERKKLK